MTKSVLEMVTLVMIPSKEDIDLELGSREKWTDWEETREVEPDCLTRGRREERGETGCICQESGVLTCLLLELLTYSGAVCANLLGG